MLLSKATYIDGGERGRGRDRLRFDPCDVWVCTRAKDARDDEGEDMENMPDDEEEDIEKVVGKRDVRQSSIQPICIPAALRHSDEIWRSRQSTTGVLIMMLI
jgi:hypothetical protein